MRHRPGAPGAGAARAGRPARQRGRCADHPPDQRGADPGGEGERLRHPHRAVREPARGPLPRRRRAARGAAVEARGGAAGGVAHQGHVASSTSPRSACRRTGASACESPAARSTCASRPSPPATASGSCCVSSTSRPASSTWTRSAWMRAPRALMDELIHKPHGILLVTGPDRLGQDDDAVRGARAPERQHPEHHDGRGPDRVLHRRHRPDPGQHQGRDDLRARPARDPAPGPRRGHDRRDPRPRDGADRRAGESHRPPGALDAAHQHRGRRHHPPARHGHRAVPALLESDRRAGPAPGAGAQSRHQAAFQGRRVRAAAPQPGSERSPRRCTARAATRPAAIAAVPASTSSSSSTTLCAP